MTIYFLMRHADYVRNFEWVLRLLAKRGHRVIIAFQREDRDDDLARRLEAEHGDRISVIRAPDRTDRWRELSWTLGTAIDYLRYHTDVYAGMDFLRNRARRGVPRIVLALARRPGVAGRLSRLLRWWQEALPTPPALAASVRAAGADLLMVTPLVSEHLQHDVATSAREAGMPVVLAVHSWDNLTNKGLVRARPDLTLVWNEVQRREAIDLHGLPEPSVVAVGAHSYDHWFEWQPSRTREAFCAEVALDPSKPFVLYVGSSRQVARYEPPIVRAWIDALRAEPALAHLGVLVRPHPSGGRNWPDGVFADLDEVAVWPAHGAEPRNEARRSDYFDSLHYAVAVVGLNTSALVEAAIMGRRTYTFVVGGSESAQRGTLHFRYLTAEGGGPLTVASSLTEHIDHLRHALGGSEVDGWERAFLERFVRPQGLDAPAASQFVEKLESFAVSFPARPSELRRVGVVEVLSGPLAAWLHRGAPR
jgi:hypothetical protein